MSEKEQNDLKTRERELQLKLVAIRLKSNLDRNLKQAKKNGEICHDFEREHFIKEDAMRLSGGVVRYSMTVTVMPCVLSHCSAARDLEQCGL